MKRLPFLLSAVAVAALTAGCPSPAAAPGKPSGDGGGSGGSLTGTWSAVGPAFPTATSDLGELRLQVGADGTPFAAYTNETKRLSVARWTGSSWTVVGGGPVVDHSVEYSSLAIGTNGQPLVTFRDITGNGIIGFRQFNGTEWEEAVSTPVAEGLGITSSLIVLPGGDRVVAFDDQGHGTSVTVVRVGTTQTVLGTRGGVAGSWPRLAAAGGELYLAHFVPVTGGNNVVVRKFDAVGNVWTALGDPVFTLGTDLAFAGSSDGHLYLALDAHYQDEAPTVLGWSGTAWTALGGGPAPVGKAGTFGLVVTSEGPLFATTGLTMLPSGPVFRRDVVLYNGGWKDAGSFTEPLFGGIRSVQLAANAAGDLYLGALEGKPAVVRKLE